MTKIRFKVALHRKHITTDDKKSLLQLMNRNEHIPENESRDISKNGQTNERHAEADKHRYLSCDKSKVALKMKC